MPGIRLIVSNYAETNFKIQLDHELRYESKNGGQPLDLRPEICAILRQAANVIEHATSLVIEGDLNDINDVTGIKVGDWSIELLPFENHGS